MASVIGHGDVLLLGGVENLLRSGSLFVEKGSLESFPVVAMGDLTDGLGSEGEGFGDLGLGHPAGKLLERKRAHTC